MTRIPLTLLTGYLGAGKTTLLNALLADASAGRIAVVVNEFGDVGLDHDLIIGTTEETVLLASGCLCCTVRGDLVTALDGLLMRRAAGDLAFERIVIETTGLADPTPILHTLVVAPQLGGRLRLDGVITVCDAVNGAATLDAGFESVQQVAMADVLVLTKTDLAHPFDIARLETRLAALAPGARLLHARHGRVPLAALFGHGAPGAGGTLPEAEAWIKAPPTAPQPPFPAQRSGPPSGPTHGLFGLPAARPSPQTAMMPPARHDDRITSVSMVIDTPIHPVMLDLWLETLLATRGAEILRLKAVLWAEGIDTPYVIHGVQHIVDPPVRLARWTGTDRKSRIVIIGRDLPQQALRDSVEMLRAGTTVHPLTA
ncbi:GTP-binding protein [Rhodobacter capsulatus]|uniref:GTP-binding protein n=1 Tax=Rhodobacter capsulatus TaxID=1061 RepID=A0A4U1JUH4_RHOCA|nr:GTP-binding protein [Rhodobacter capsulatus]TKD22823.1 GTP-binding protein [Rhodobacter capsulatus]